MKPRTVDWWFILSNFVYLLSRRVEKQKLFTRNNTITYHDQALIYYSYNRTWISFMFQNFAMSLHFQLLSPPITTVFRSKPTLKVLLGKLRPYTFGLIVAGPKPRSHDYTSFFSCAEMSPLYFVSICKRVLLRLWILPSAINYVRKFYNVIDKILALV